MMQPVTDEWGRMNHLQLGRCAEQLISIMFTVHGLSVFSAEVDDRGIDLVVRTAGGKHYDVQVKSSRNLNYVFFPKSTFIPGEQMLAALVLIQNDPSHQVFLIPSLAWLEPNALLASKDYEGQKSKPEWGVNLSAKNLPLLGPYAFEKVVSTL